MFGISRASIREAIQKLEYYGILKSVPQSGTFIANIGVIAINGIIKSILRLEDPNFKSLVETKILLELNTTSLAAQKSTHEDLEEIEVALQAYINKVQKKRICFTRRLAFSLGNSQSKW